MRWIVECIIQSVVALGTMGALIAALYQIKRDNKLRYEERRKEQASKVAAWFEEIAITPKTSISNRSVSRGAMIRNDNLTPVYNVVVTVVGLHGAGPSKHGEDNDGDYTYRALFPQIANGLWGTWVDTVGGGMGVVCVLEISFRDGAGVSWIRRGDGSLVEIDKDPLEYYSIPRPISWNSIERIG